MPKKRKTTTSRRAKPAPRRAAMPPIDYSKPQQSWLFDVRVPLDPAKPGGKSIPARGRIISAVSEAAVKVNTYIIDVFSIADPPEWCGESRHAMVAKWRPATSDFLVTAAATEAMRKVWRVPGFIQGEEWPLCCGRSMFFVGELEDDGDLKSDPPANAELWWHDTAYFYVFTCTVCLECKAVGQQF